VGGRSVNRFAEDELVGALVEAAGRYRSREDGP